MTKVGCKQWETLDDSGKHDMFILKISFKNLYFVEIRSVCNNEKTYRLLR